MAPTITPGFLGKGRSSRLKEISPFFMYGPQSLVSRYIQASSFQEKTQGPSRAWHWRLEDILILPIGLIFQGNIQKKIEYTSLPPAISWFQRSDIWQRLSESLEDQVLERAQ